MLVVENIIIEENKDSKMVGIHHYQLVTMKSIVVVTTLLLLSITTYHTTLGFSSSVVNTNAPNKLQQQQQQQQRQQSFTSLSARTTKDDDQKKDDDQLDPLTKSSWYAVELFGKVFGGGGKSSSKKDEDDSEEYSGPPKSLKETLDRIKLDNDRSYFLSGQVDEDIYNEDCVFSDPFVSFAGRERFVTNLANLGSFITNYSAKVLNYETTGTDTIVQTKIMVKLELNLPWKPILAWPWGVKYTIDPETCLIVDHEESWDIEPLEGVKQIFRKPTLRI